MKQLSKFNQYNSFTSPHAYFLQWKAKIYEYMNNILLMPVLHIPMMITACAVNKSIFRICFWGFDINSASQTLIDFFSMLYFILHFNIFHYSQLDLPWTECDINSCWPWCTRHFLLLLTCSLIIWVIHTSQLHLILVWLWHIVLQVSLCLLKSFWGRVWCLSKGTSIAAIVLWVV